MSSRASLTDTATISGVTEDIPASALRARGRKDYYSFGGAIVAMKEGVTSAPRTLSYIFGDHLGSASLTTNASGQKVSEQRYKPYVEVRWTGGAGMPTDFTFTGQRAEPANYVGSLMDYVARGYSPALGRFISADTIVPGAGNPQAFNRYMYVRGNPLSAIDPSGHETVLCDLGCDDPQNGVTWNLGEIVNYYLGDETPAGIILSDLLDRSRTQDVQLDRWFDQHLEYHPSRDIDAAQLGLSLQVRTSWEWWMLGRIAKGDEAATSRSDGATMLASGAGAIGGGYVLRNRVTDEIEYVGRTNDFSRRANEHNRDTNKTGLNFDPVYWTNDRKVQRGLEQELYDKYQPRANLIRPISLANLNITSYIGAASHS